MTEYKLRQPLSRKLEPLGLFVYILIITDLSVGLIERDERLLLGAWGCRREKEMRFNSYHPVRQLGEGGSKLVQRGIQGVQLPIQREEVEGRLTVG
jgi:hypothetical protein